MKSDMHICVFLRLLLYFTRPYGLSHVNKPFIFFLIKMIYCIILIFVIFSHNKLSVGFSAALKRN